MPAGCQKPCEGLRFPLASAADRYWNAANDVKFCFEGDFKSFGVQRGSNTLRLAAQPADTAVFRDGSCTSSLTLLEEHRAVETRRMHISLGAHPQDETGKLRPADCGTLSLQPSDQHGSRATVRTVSRHARHVMKRR